jgi:xanthosine utilization system XapX-like protein
LNAKAIFIWWSISQMRMLVTLPGDILIVTIVGVVGIEVGEEVVIAMTGDLLGGIALRDRHEPRAQKGSLVPKGLLRN